MSDVEAGNDTPITDVAGSEAPEGVESKAPVERDEVESKILATLARKQGWSPKEDWKGDPDKWVDAEQFLDNTAAINKALRKQVKDHANQIEGVNRAAQKAIETARQRALADLRREHAQAVRDGDEEAAAAAVEEIVKTAAQTGETPVDKFTKKNPWFGTDTAATKWARAAAQVVADEGGSAQEQLEAAEQAVRDKFPKLFDDAPEDSPSRPASKSPPALQPGQRATQTAPRAKTWASLPPAVQAQAEKAYVSKGMLTREEYAKTYFEENA